MLKRPDWLLSLFGNEKEAAAQMPYERAPGLLTLEELSFYHVLLLALDVMGLKAMVCPKVGLRDVFCVVSQDDGEYMGYLDQIDRMHVDFLLCDPRDMTLIAGVELDDDAHITEGSQAREAFVEKVYEAAGLPLLRFRVQHDYDIPGMVRYIRDKLAIPAAAENAEPSMNQSLQHVSTEGKKAVSPVETQIQAAREESAAAAMPDAPVCPRCGAPMVLRRAHRGKREGRHFWGCSRFPLCRCVADMKVIL